MRGFHWWRLRGWTTPFFFPYSRQPIDTMSESTKKRTLDAFFKPPPKKARVSDKEDAEKGGKGTIDEDQVSLATSLSISTHVNAQYITGKRVFKPSNIPIACSVFSKVNWNRPKVNSLHNWSNHQWSSGSRPPLLRAIYPKIPWTTSLSISP